MAFISLIQQSPIVPGQRNCRDHNISPISALYSEMSICQNVLVDDQSWRLRHLPYGLYRETVKKYVTVNPVTMDAQMSLTLAHPQLQGWP